MPLCPHTFPYRLRIYTFAYFVAAGTGASFGVTFAHGLVALPWRAFHFFAKHSPFLAVLVDLPFRTFPMPILLPAHTRWTLALRLPPPPLFAYTVGSRWTFGPCPAHSRCLLPVKTLAFCHLPDTYADHPTHRLTGLGVDITRGACGRDTPLRFPNFYAFVRYALPSGWALVGYTRTAHATRCVVAVLTVCHLPFAAVLRLTPFTSDSAC